MNYSNQPKPFILKKNILSFQFIQITFGNSPMYYLMRNFFFVALLINLYQTFVFDKIIFYWTYQMSTTRVFHVEFISIEH